MCTLTNGREHAAIDRAVVMALQRIMDYAVIPLDRTYETRQDPEQLHFHYTGGFMLARDNAPLQYVEVRGTLRYDYDQWVAERLQCQLDGDGIWHEAHFSTNLAVPGALYWFRHKRLVSAA